MFLIEAVFSYCRFVRLGQSAVAEHSFSSTFEIVGSKLIGQWDEKAIGFSPVLGIITICAIFNDLGQYSSCMVLNIYIRSTSPSVYSSFSILAVIRAWCLFLFNILVTSFISFKVNAERRSCDLTGVARSCQISWF